MQKLRKFVEEWSVMRSRETLEDSDLVYLA
jgi:hypothetical protein